LEEKVMHLYHNVSELSAHSFYQVDKNLIAALDDFLLAGVLSMLINTMGSPYVEQYRRENNDYFFVTVEKMKDELRIADKVQRRCLSELEGKGLISLANFGIPCKRHVKIESEAICRFLNVYLESQQEEVVSESKSKDDFYNAINEAIFEGEEAFAESIGNMDAKIAGPLYVFTRGLYLYHQIVFKWDTINYGKFKNIIGLKSVDLRRMLDILADDSFKSANNILWQYKTISKKTTEQSPQSRVVKASLLPEWSRISQKVTF
jgi:hypothetical protein